MKLYKWNIAYSPFNLYFSQKIFFVYKPHRESRMVSPGGLPVYEEKKLWWIGFDNFLQNEKNFKTIHIDPDSTVKLQTIIETGSPLKYRKFATPWALVCCTVSLSGYICRIKRAKLTLHWLVKTGQYDWMQYVQYTLCTVYIMYSIH